MSLSSPHEYIYFNINDDLSLIEIKEQKNGKNCFICDKIDNSIIYNGFTLYKKQVEVVCELSFFKSSKTEKYIPRPIFKKRNTKSNNVTIEFDKSEKAINFWKLINFLNNYKNIVDTGDFENSYSVIKSDYFLVFENKEEKEKLQDLSELIENNKISETDLKEVFSNQRKKTLRIFFYLLKNLPYEKTTSIEAYRKKHKLTSRGEEAVWHHFLKSNDWILGLNVDIKFIKDFFNETDIGIKNSEGKGSPHNDILGLSNYSILIELKTAKTEIFKRVKSKSRTNTWDFTTDFIEGLSQCLAQKSALESNYDKKIFIKKDKTRVDKEIYRTLDPKTVFIIGNRSCEFPHSNRNDESIIKSETFERFRRNNRNVDIITFDELFERAYHIVFSHKIDEDWYDKDKIEI